MKDEDKTKEELLDELKEFRRQVEELKNDESRQGQPWGGLFNGGHFLETVINSLPGIFYLFDDKGKLHLWNRNLEEVSRYSRDEISNMTPLDFFVGKDRDVISRVIQEVFDRGESSVGSNFVSKDGKSIPYFFSALRLIKDEVNYVVGMGIDITEQKELEERLREVSITDELTGLTNRRGFFAFAQKQCEIASRKNFNLYFIFVDLDGLKSINDRFGHQTGDVALIDSANILKESFRSSDLIARVGGDEFVIMAMETPETDVDILTKRLRTNLDSHNSKGGKPYGLELSMGITQFNPEHPCTIDELISEADRLMYEEKKKKRS